MTAVLEANITAGVRAGAHLCAVFSSDAERDELLRGFFRARKDELLVFVGGAASAPLPTDLHSFVEQRDGDGLYLAGGGFDGGRVIDELRDTIAEALRGGYRRLRVAGDMGWVPASGTNEAWLLRYEEEVNPLYADGTAAGMCLYDSRSFATDVLDELASVHPFVTGADERRPLRSFTASRADDGTLCLRGEIDYFGAPHLATLIDDMADAAQDVVLDVGGVRFMDAAALHALDEAARRLPEPGRLILRSPSRVVSRLLALLPQSDAPRLVAVSGDEAPVS